MPPASEGRTAPVLVALAILLGAPAGAQSVIGYHVPTTMGWSPVSNPTAAPAVSSPIVITQPSSPWIKVWLGGMNLGSGSSVRITGAQDEAVQVLDAAGLAAWSSSSAYFNGDTVTVELIVAPGDTASGWVTGFDAGFLSPSGADSICLYSDDRVPVWEPRVGRLLNSSLSMACSGSLVSSNGCYLSAGHCFASGSVFTVEFNCPPSLPSGSIVHPGPEHQYPVVYATLGAVNGGIGNDWALVKLGSNTTTGFPPALLQGFYRLAPSMPAVGSTARVTGFGASTSGVDNYANQTDDGPVMLVGGSSGTQVAYQVDTTGGSSGSPVIDEATVKVVGVHTNAGCNGSAFSANSGTSITHAGIQGYYNTNCIPAAPAHAINLTQAGPGQTLVITVTNAPPSSELVNLASFMPATPTDTGAFFGMALGRGSGDPTGFFFLPIGAQPFHVLADASGSYTFMAATSFPGVPVTVDIVSLAFVPGTGYTGYWGRSPVVKVTFSL